MPRLPRLLLPSSVVAGVALGALLCCVSPDEIGLALFGGHTNYPSETSQFDSANYGAEVGLSWDVGKRAESNEAAIETRELLAHRLPAPPPPKANDKPATENAQLIAALIALAAAVAGYFQRANIAKGVRHVHAKITTKKEKP